MYLEDVKDFLKKELRNNLDYLSVKEINKLIKKNGSIYLINISLSSLQRIINKLNDSGFLNHVINTREHPKRFPIKKYQLNNKLT